MVDDELKSAFDARKSYSNVVELALKEEKALANIGDMYRWARSLRTLLSLVIAYLPVEKANALDVRLRAAQNLASTMGNNYKVRQSVQNGLDQELREIEYEVHRLAASFMWPTTTTGNDNFDMDEFMRGSGL